MVAVDLSGVVLAVLAVLVPDTIPLAGHCNAEPIQEVVDPEGSAAEVACFDLAKVPKIASLWGQAC